MMITAMTEDTQPNSRAIGLKMAGVLKESGERTGILDKIDSVRQIEKAKLKINDLSFYYGKFKALHNVTMQIPDKQVTAFIGPSGCGKSTLLRIFNRMYDLYPGQTASGEIMLDEQNILSSSVDVN
ncbi:MAG: phosphate ABC transporter ATP-binding protein, partial [Halothiobacillus sp. 20-54-6]